jgi:hypothetical protein
MTTLAWWAVLSAGTVIRPPVITAAIGAVRSQASMATRRTTSCRVMMPSATRLPSSTTTTASPCVLSSSCSVSRTLVDGPTIKG